MGIGDTNLPTGAKEQNPATAVAQKCARCHARPRGTATLRLQHLTSSSARRPTRTARGFAQRAGMPPVRLSVLCFVAAVPFVNGARISTSFHH